MLLHLIIMIYYTGVQYIQNIGIHKLYFPPVQYFYLSKNSVECGNQVNV